MSLFFIIWVGGVYLNPNYIVGMSDSQGDCRINVIDSGYVAVENEKCADVIRDIEAQIDDKIGKMEKGSENGR